MYRRSRSISPTRRRMLPTRWLSMHCCGLPLVVSALLLAVAITPVRAGLPPTAVPDIAAIDAYIDMQMRDQRIPGLALGIVQGGKIVALKGFGVAAPSGEMVTPSTAFSIGSLTKSFTAVATMQLVAAGRLELDMPVQRYLPWFQLADAPASARITVRHLLTHTSGLPRDFAPPAATSSAQQAQALEARLRTLATVPLEQPLGVYGYSNVGYQVLALLIQTVSGQSYNAYIHDHIFVPLDMQHSFATIEEAVQHNLATGYQYWFGLPVASGLPPYRTGPGNGGLFSSAEDMAHYLIAHLNQGHYRAATLLDGARIADMHRPAVARANGAYAMGWGVHQVDGITLLAHSGQTYNYLGKMLLAPEQGWGVVVLQNAQSMVRLASGDARQDAIADGVMALLLDRPVPTQPITVVPLLVYAGLVLLLLAQLGALVMLVVVLRSGHQQAERRPQGIGWRHGLRAMLVTGSLGWAALVLIGFPLTNDLVMLSYQMPDVTYGLLASGILALGWGILRLWGASWLPPLG